MTLAANYSPASYTATPGQTVFAIPWRFLAEGDLVVTVDNVTKTLTTDYSVTITPLPGIGGSVTFVVPMVGGESVIIYRWLEISQETDYVENEARPAETDEQVLDRIVMIEQQLAARTGGLDFTTESTDALRFVIGSTTLWDGRGFRLTDLATPTASGDAATKGYVDAISVAAGNVPTPDDPGDDGKVLTAQSGAFDWQTAAASLVPTPADPADDGKHVAAAAGVYALRTAAQSRTDLGLGTAATLNVGTGANQVVQLTAAAKYPAVDGSLITNLATGIIENNIVIIQDQKNLDTHGGTFTQGAWQTHVLNTEVKDTGSLATLAANRVTLASGKYLVWATAAAFDVDAHQLRIRNVTAGTTLAVGTNAYAAAVPNSGDHASLIGVISVNGTDEIELQHQCTNTRATDGFGRKGNFTDGTKEVYATIFFLKLAS